MVGSPFESFSFVFRVFNSHRYFLGIRMSTSRAFIRPVQDRSNLHVMLNTTVTKVLVHPKSKNAQGVEAVDAFGHTMKILAKKEVIVAGGAVNSPQILLLSGIGPKEDLTRVGIRPIVDLPGVGKNLHNHVAFFTNFFINDTDTSPLNWATAMEYLLFRDGLMSGTGISAVTGKISSRYVERPGVPDLQVCFKSSFAPIKCSLINSIHCYFSFISLDFWQAAPRPVKLVNYFRTIHDPSKCSLQFCIQRVVATLHCTQTIHWHHPKSLPTIWTKNMTYVC